MALRRDNHLGARRQGAANGDLNSAHCRALIPRLALSATGLSTPEAEKRLAEYGPNEVGAPHLNATLWDLLRVAAGPLTSILLVAGLASAWLGEVTNAVIIGAIVALSTGINVWLNYRSRRAVLRLQQQITPTATVKRDDRWQERPRRQLVPGDVVRLTAGDLVPADLRILVARDLFIDQSSVTGESMPREKFSSGLDTLEPDPDSSDFAFLGTSVVSGTGDAMVYATGKGTTFGDIVGRLAARPDETEFERGMHAFGMLILQTVFFLVLFILIVNISLGRDALSSVLFSVALAVGLTPEFLPMITTVTLAQGATKMARDKVIIKNLPAIQNLGSIDILCCDKTGTITSGEMTLTAALDPLGRAAPTPLRLAALNAAFETGVKSPLDTAILAVQREDQTSAEKTDEIPFDFERRRVSVVVRQETDYLLIAKGAPEGLLMACTGFEVEGSVQTLDEEAHAACLKTFQDLSAKGFRVLGVAYRRVQKPAGFTIHDEREMILAGFLAFADEPLAGISDSLARLRADGIRLKILTGDNELVTRHICSQVGIDGQRIMLGQEIERLDDGALAQVCEEVHVFARVSPGQKYRIMRALKARGHVVGFLGDGINDAPSLHGADVGICAAGAVDIAREASDIILLERHLDVLHAGIIAGRRSYANVVKYLLMGTSSNFGNMFSMAAAAVFLPFLPMLPTQILLNNFLYDLAQITIPTDHIDPDFVKKPQAWDIRLIRNFMLIIGPVSSFYDFLTFFVMLRVFHFDAKEFHTGWFLESLATQTLVLFVIRTVGRPWLSRPSIWLTLTTLAVVVVGMVLPLTPLARSLELAVLPPYYFVFLALVVGSYLGIVEVVKARFLKRYFVA